MKNILRAIFLMAGVFIASNVEVMAAPFNDFWQDASLITGASGSKTGTTIGATNQMCEPAHVFPDGDGSLQAQYTVWYKYMASETASYTFTVSSSTQHTLSAYAIAPGICGQTAMSIPYRLTENRLYGIAGSDEAHSRVSLKVPAGAVIYLAVDGLVP